MPKSLAKQRENTFKTLFYKQKKQSLLLEQEQAEYDDLLDICPMTDLCEWSSHVLLILDQEGKAAPEEPKKALFSAAKDNEDFQTLINDLNLTEDAILVPPDYSWLVLNFYLSSGLFRLRKTKKEAGDHYEGLDFTASAVQANLTLFSNAFTVKSSVEDCEFSSWEDAFPPVVFCRKVDPTETLLDFEFRLHPQDLSAMSYTRVHTAAVEARYSPQVLSLLVGFFAVPNVQEAVKVAAWDQLEKLQDRAQGRLTAALFSSEDHCIELDLVAPVLILPMDAEDEYLQLKLGRCLVRNDQMDSISDTHERFYIELKDTELLYTKSRLFPPVSIIQPLQVTINVGLLTKDLRIQKKTQIQGPLTLLPDVTVTITLARFRLNFAYGIYHKLMNIRDYLRIDEEAWEAVALEKRGIMHQATLFDLIQRQGSSFRDWHSHLAVLSGAYLYFFNTPQAAFASSYFYIKDCVIKDPGEVPNSLQLQNRYGTYTLAFESDKQKDKWKRAISDRVIDLQALTGPRLSMEIDGSPRKKSRNLILEMRAEMDEFAVELRHEDGVPWLRLTVETVSGCMKRRTYDSQATLSFGKVSICDLQDAGAFRYILVDRKEPGTVIPVTISTAEPPSDQYDETDLHIGVQFHGLLFNWSYDTLCALIHFLKSRPSLSQSPASVSSIQETHVLLNLEMSVSALEMNLVCPQSQVTLVRCMFQTAEIWFQVRNNGYQFEGDIGKLTVSDVTDYPRMAAYLMYDEIQPFVMLMARAEPEHLLSFRIVLLEDDSTQVVDFVTNTVDINIPSATLTYLHQPICRLVEFYNSKILGLFDEQMRTENLMRLQREGHSCFGFDLPSYHPLEPFSKRLTKLSIKFKSPKIVLAPRAHYRDFFMLSASSILISNVQKESSSRHPVNSVLIDRVEFEVKNLGIASSGWVVLKGVDLNVGLERVLGTGDGKLMDDLDQSYHLDIKGDNVGFCLEQAHYALLLKLFDLNFTYDDQLDRFFDPETFKKPQKSVEAEHKGLFIQLLVDLKCFRLTLSKTQEEFADFQMINTQFRLWKYNDFYLELDLNTQKFLLSAPQSIRLQRFTSDLEEKSSLDYSPGRPKRTNSWLESDTEVLIKPLIDTEKELGGKMVPVLHFTMKKQPDSEKEIVVNFAELRLEVKLALLIQIQNYFFYGIPDYSKEVDTPFDYMNKYRPRKEQTNSLIPERWDPPRIRAAVYFDHPNLILPLDAGQRRLITEGEILYTYERAAAQSEDIETPGVTKILQCSGVNVFVCETEALNRLADFRGIKKRRVLEPVEINYESVQLIRGRQRLGYQIKYSSSKLTFLTTFSDLRLISDSFHYQKTLFSDSSELTESLCLALPLPNTDESPIVTKRSFKRMTTFNSPETLNSKEKEGTPQRALTIVAKKNPFNSVEVEATYKKRFVCEGISVVVLNDRVMAYCPVLDFAASRFEVNCDVKKSTSIENSELICRLKAYNPVTDSWEPLIEPFNLILQRLWNESELPETQWLLSVSSDVPLDLTVSEGTMGRLYKSWKDWQTPIPVLSFSSQSVSPVTISNQTSLTLFVEKKSQVRNRRKSLVLEENMLLEPGESQPFQLDVQGGRVSELMRFSLKENEDVVDQFTGVNLKRVHTSAHEFMYRDRSCSVIVAVTVEDSVKTVTLGSPVVFQNDTDYDFWFLFAEEVVCLTGQSVSVPLHLCKSRVSILPKLEGGSSWQPVDLSELNEPTEFSARDLYFLLVPRSDEHKLKTVVHVSAPVTLRSAVPLPIKILLQNAASRHPSNEALSKGDTQRVYHYSSYEDLYLSISIQSYMTSEPTLIFSRSATPAKTVKLQDMSGETLELYLDYKKTDFLLVTVYAAMVIINSTSLPLTFYYKSTGSVRRIPGQLNPAIVLSDECRKLCLGLDKCRSRPFKTGAAGALNIITVDTEEDREGDSIRYQFVYNVEVAWLFAREVLYTRVVTVTPRFIFVNGLNLELLVRQTGMTECCLSVKQGEQMPFYWPNGKLNELIQVTVSPGNRLSNPLYAWSGSLSISSIGVVAFACMPLTDFKEVLHLRAEVKFTDLSAIVTFEEETDRYCSYRIENLSSLISFRLHQAETPETVLWLDTNSTAVFSWQEPMLGHRLVAEMLLGSLKAFAVKSSAAYWFDVDKMNEIRKIKIEFTDELGQYITARTLNIGTCKVLRFYDSVLRLEDTREADPAATQVTVTVPRLGISLVETESSRSSELVYLSLHRLELRVMRSKTSQQFEMIIDRVQIDNQHSLRACFPVLLAPKLQPGHFKPTVSLTLDYHLDQNPNCFHVQVAEVQIQPLIIQVESLLMVRLMALWERVAPSTIGSMAFQNISTRQGQRTQAYLKDYKVSYAEKSFYFSQLRLYPVQIFLSFLPVKDMEDEDSDTFRAFIHAVGMVVSTIDSAPLDFAAVEKSDLMGMQKQITSALWMSYRSQLVAKLLFLIGHSNILGNPVGLLDGLGRGVVDFFAAPAHGMRTGPIDAGLGLIKGAESLLKNTVSATFGSVSKLAGSMATGLSALTQDKFSLQERQRESVTARPTNMMEGMEMGVKSLFKNIGKGISGIVTEPLKGAKKDGLSGLLSGSLKGIGGLVAQPVAGVFDMTSRTAEGIVNTAADSVASLERVRSPRVLYNLACKLLPFRAEDATVRLFMAQLKKGRYMRDHYVCYSQVVDMNQAKFLVILTVEHVLFVLCHNRKVILEIPCGDIQQQKIAGKGLEVQTLPSKYKVIFMQKTIGQSVFTIPLVHREALERLNKKLSKVRKRDWI